MIQPFKIGFVGSHGTGKSTLCEALREQLRNNGVAATLIDEIPRRICALRGDPDFFKRGSNTPLRQIVLILLQVLEEATAPRVPGVLLCDRTVLDHWAYTSSLFRNALVEEGVFDLLESAVLRHVASYDLVIHVPIEFGLRVDDVREADEEFRHLIDSELRTFLADHKIAHQKISGPINSRVNQSQAAIQLVLSDELQFGRSPEFIVYPPLA